MSMPQADLDNRARAINAAIEGMGFAHHLEEESQSLQAHEVQEAANEQAKCTLRQLIYHGARGEGLPAAVPVPLELLNTRRLCDGLKYAYDAAQAVNRERGHVLTSGDGCGWTDVVGDVYKWLRQEVEGPRDVRQGRK